MSDKTVISIDEELQSSAPAPGKRRRRRFIGIAFLLIVASAFYLRSDRFQNQVRLKVIAELERVTGGTVELPSFKWNLSKLEFIAENLTIHGLEAPDQTPYAHVDSLKVRLKILSLFGREFGLRVVDAQHPVIHIIVNPDGTNNQPRPKIKDVEGSSSRVDMLFALAIDHANVSNGMLIWNDQKTPLNIRAEKLSAQMTYAPLDRRYEGTISVGSSLGTLGSFKPLSSEAEVQFSVINTEAGIKSLKWSSPGSRLEASGRIVNFFNPEIELNYSGIVSIAELGSTIGYQDLRSGTAEIHGSAKFSNVGHASLYTSNGKLSVKNLLWRNDLLSIPGIDASSAFSVDRDKLTLTGINGRFLGGSVQGKAEIVNWTNPNRKVLAADEKAQRGTAELRLQGVRAGDVASALSSRALPLARLRAEGSTAGTVAINWRGSPANATAALNLTVDPPAASSANSLPLNARLRGTYILPSQQLDIVELNLSTPATRIKASGILGSETSQLTMTASTENLREFDPIISAQETGLPVSLQGRASFNGTVAGRLALPTIRGHLELAAFDSLVNLNIKSKTLTAAASQVPQPVRWDSMTVDLQYSPQFISAANGLLHRGASQIVFSGRSTLTKGKFDDTSAFFLQSQVRNAPVSDIQNLVGTAYPLTGTLNLVATASGTMNDLHGNGSLQVAGGSILNEPFKTLRSDFRLAGREAQFSNVELLQNGAQVTGSGAYNLTTEVFRFNARGENFDLAHIQVLQRPRLSLAGRARFQASGSGTLEQPTINANVLLTQLVANGESIGDTTINAVTHGREMQINGESHLNGAEVTAKGKIELQQDFPGTVEVRFNNLDFDPLLRAYLEGRVTGHSSASGTVTASGPLRYPRLLRATGTIERMSAEIEKVQLRNAEPIVIGLENQNFLVQKFHVTGEGTDLTAEGTIGLPGEHTLYARANGKANLKLFQGFSPGLLSSGTTTMQLTAGGTINNPAVTGEVKIENAGVSFIDLPNGLSDINGTFAFNENRLQIRTLTAHTGGGTLNVGGFIAYRRGLYFNLTANGQDIRLRYPPGISAVANTDLRLSGTLQSALLSGDVTVTRFGVNPKFDFASYLAHSKQPLLMGRSTSAVDNIRLDVHVVSTPELEVQTSLAKIAGDADLRLRGSMARPVVLGRINIVEGDVFFSGTKYHLERGDISFVNPARIEPILNIEASARVREYDITLGFHGSIDKLSTNYRSEPPLPTADIIALLALGRTREDSALTRPTNQAFSDNASNAILGQALNAALSSRVQRLFGVSRIKIDPQVGGAENNPNARLTIEQQVNNNITLTYITNLASSAQQFIQMEYNVNKNISIIAVRDQNGVIGFEVRMRQRKK